jgi:hypothetical protein
MAKKREPSKHSRAARRATSPGIDLDKSLKDLKPVRQSAAPRPSVLAAHQSAGIHKKARRGRHQSAKARRRHEKGIEMAEAVTERTGQKIKRSFGRERVVKDRSKEWDKVNRDALADAEKAEDDEADADDDDEERAWETDEDMDAGKAGAADEPAEAAPAPAPAPVAAPKTTDDDDDEIL